MLKDLVIAADSGTPIVLVTTTDQQAAQSAIAGRFSKRPLVTWDCLRGFIAVNASGKAAIDAILPKDAFPGTTPGLNPAEAFMFLLGDPGARKPGIAEKTIVMVHNAHKEWIEKPFVQGISLTRDAFKVDSRILVLFAPAAMLPSEVVQDVVVIDDPLPDAEGLAKILDEQLTLAREAYPKLADPDPKERASIVSALAGLTAYASEAAIALAIGETKGQRVDPKIVWRRKRDVIGQIKGLKWDSWTEGFDQLGGLQAAKDFAEEIFAGDPAPRVVFRIDEIEKQMAGFGGDNTGVTQDIVGTVLRTMEDEKWSGLVAVGPPGSGKTIFSRALGATYKVPTIELDLGAVKDSLVGASEANIRAALKVIKAIGGADVFGIATCNKLDILPPELRRRFTYGVWYFDLPTKDELEVIWDVNLKAHGLPLDSPRPPHENWTGAEIRNVCKMAAQARKRGKTPADMARYIVPVATADPAMIERLRASADGKFLSASTPGMYHRDPVRAKLTDDDTLLTQVRRTYGTKES